LTAAIALLAKRRSPAGLLELIALLEAGTDELAGAGGSDQVRQSLVESLVALLGNADVFSSGAEPLTAATLLRPTAPGRVPLAIIHTGSLGDGPRLHSWMAQLIAAVNRDLASRASTTLQALLVVDGADLFLPGDSGKTSSKEPLQDLLERAGAAGLGLVLTSRHPGELDYRRCASIETWFLGKIDEQTLGRMKPLFEQRPLGRRNPSKLESGRFVMLGGGNARDVERGSALIQIQPLEAAELKLLAAQTHPRARDTPPPRRPEASGGDASPQPPQPR
jgi:Ca2+-binding RTX toxin-like protein